MKKIVMFDTSHGTQNMGDYIINASINKELNSILEDNFVVRYSTHNSVLKFLQNFRKNPINKYCKEADYKFLCGTNLLKKNLIHLWNDFNINVFDIKCFSNSISIGCGIASNGKGLNFYTKYIYKKILSMNYIHSTRDDKSKKFIEDLGFKAINTGCPTLWSLTKEHCKKINKDKSENVVFTLTDYKKDIKNDQKLIDILNKNYKKIFFWVQGSNDLDYLKSFKNIDNIIVLGPSLEKYEKVLKNGNIDYVGTRLHAGIFAMQNFVRSIVLIVDNRTRDMKETYNIISVERDDVKNIDKLINSKFETKINIDEDRINEWKKQFEV